MKTKNLLITSLFSVFVFAILSTSAFACEKKNNACGLQLHPFPDGWIHDNNGKIVDMDGFTLPAELAYSRLMANNKLRDATLPVGTLPTDYDVQVVYKNDKPTYTIMYHKKNVYFEGCGKRLHRNINGTEVLAYKNVCKRTKMEWVEANL